MNRRPTNPLFHGTSSANLASIKARGLQPCAAPGADTWAKQAGERDLAAHSATRAPSVYLSETDYGAGMFALLAAKVHGGTPVVLSLELEPRELAQLIADEDQDNPDAPLYWRMPGAVPAARIKGQSKPNAEARRLEETQEPGSAEDMLRQLLLAGC